MFRLRLYAFRCAPSIAPERAAAPEVHRCVMHEVPDATADEAVGALVDLRCLDDLLLDGAELTANAHDAAVLDPISPGHEASVVGPQGSREHACIPRPVHGAQLQRIAEQILLLAEVDLVSLCDVRASDDALLLTWVRDLRDRRDRPF